MKLTKSKLKQFIKEEITQTMKEGDVMEAGIAPGHPWPPDADPAGEELPPEFQYEYVLDELVNAARDATLKLAVEKLKAANAFAPTMGGKPVGDPRLRRSGMTYNDLELEIEEGLLDALTPLAKIIHAKTNNPTYLTEAAYKVGAKVEYDSEDRGVGEVIACYPGAKGDICVRWKDGVSTHHRWALRPAKKGKKK